MDSPEYHAFDEYKDRLKALGEIRDLGVDPYPYKYEITHKPSELVKSYESEALGAPSRHS